MKSIILVLCIFTTLHAQDLVFEQRVFIAASQARVWEALTQAEHINAYYMCPLKTIGNKVGDGIEYGMDKQVMISGKITAYEKNVLLAHSFRFNAANHQDTDHDKATLVEYKLEAVRGRTGICMLTVKHSGFLDNNQTFANVTSGWPWIMSNLKTYVETGKNMVDARDIPTEEKP